jgi:hypothetical protein
VIQTELDVEEEQQPGGADQGQRRGDQAVEAGLEHLVDRVDVGGLPGDHPARGVAVVEGRAEHLEVPEHPAPQLEEHVLTDLAGPDEEHLARHRLGQGGHEHQPHDQEERLEVVAGSDGRDAGVDALLDQVGDGQAGGVLDHDDRDQDPDRPLVGGEELA